jgi:NAD(P)-dependent dehydrogenase (short-subunit alcohol dehydrogenase family)
MAQNDLFSLDGQVAVVIGGGGVLAGAMATGLAEAGADVAVLDLNLENAEVRTKAIRDLGQRAIAVQANAASKTDLTRALDTILKQLGRVDILEWQRILDVNLKSVFLACQIFGKAMVDAGHGGSVINISSVSSGPPLSKVFTYGITKAGVNQITQFLAREWATAGVRVNAIVPGFFPAEQNRKLLTPERTAAILGHTPMARYGEAAELIGAAVYLASSKASSFVTGTILRVDGGFLATTI